MDFNLVQLLNFRHILLHPEYGKIYRIGLDNKLFSNAVHITTTVFEGFKGNLPTLSRLYSKYHRRKFRNGISSETRFENTYSIFEYKSLPAPYETRCSTESQFTCNSRCHISLMEKHLQTLPINWLYPEDRAQVRDSVYMGNYDFPFMKLGDYANETLYKLHSKFYDECSSLCRTDSCRRTVYSTTVLAVVATWYPELLEFGIHLPLTQTTTIEFKALFPLMDYIIYVTSCFGTWLGLSVFNLNPVNLFAENLPTSISANACHFTSHRRREQERVKRRLVAMEAHCKQQSAHIQSLLLNHARLAQLVATNRQDS